jgi:hypothetical protein
VSDAAVVIILLIGAFLVALPSVRSWLRSSRSERLVDPEQSITVDSVPGLPGIYQTNYRQRMLLRGRRHPAPPGAVIHRREREEPPTTASESE